MDRSQYDAAATPMYASFTSKADPTPYAALPARIDLNARNAATAYGARRSLAFDFSEYDRLTVSDEQALNRILWHSIRGAHVPYPGVTRRPLLSHQGRSLIPPGGEDEEEERVGRPAAR